MNAIAPINSNDRPRRGQSSLLNCWPILLLVISLAWMLVNLLVPLCALFQHISVGESFPLQGVLPEGTDPFFWWFKTCLLPFVVAWFASARLKKRTIS